MSIATDTRYRTIRVSFLNNDQDGSELVQLLAKPSGGAWAAQRTFPVSLAGDQETEWSSALPLTLYDVALRYMVGRIPAVGYESSSPDAWTAPTAAGSKSTVTTSCAVATALAGALFTSAATPIRLTWACANQGVPFLLEKNPGAGWSTVVADLVAESYDYTVPGAELDTTVQFRVTPKRGAVAGTTSAPISVLMQVVVGATAITPTFNALTAVIDLVWTEASLATTYFVEKKVGAGAWGSLVTIGGLSYSFGITAAEENLIVQFRVTGRNGVVNGPVSAAAPVTTTLAIGVTTQLGMGKMLDAAGPPPQYWRVFNTCTMASGATTTGTEIYREGVLVQAVSASSAYVTDLVYPGVYGITYTARARGYNGAAFGPWSTFASVVV